MGKYTLYAERPSDKYRKGDLIFVVTVILLWGLGIFTLYICTPNTAYRLFGDRYYFVTRQLYWSIAAFVTFLVASFVPMRFIRKILPVFVIGALVLCFFTLIPGIGYERKGAPRWIRIGSSATFQPSEMAKVAVVLFLANLFDKDKKKTELEEDGVSAIYPLIGLFSFVLVIFLQKDFSTGIFVSIVGLSMFFVTGARLTWFLPMVLLAIPATVLMITLEPFRLMRVVSFFHPEEFVLTTGYQQFASQRAISAGGIWGTGFGTGMTSVNSIPEIQTDYIFAGWTNSMGLIGVSVYFVILCVFGWRGFYIAFHSKDRFAAYGSFGFTLAILMQSFINCAVVCGAMPTTGIPLPFFSSGGSSLVFTMLMCGFIFNASHCEDEEVVQSENYEVDIESNDESIIIDNITEWGAKNE